MGILLFSVPYIVRVLTYTDSFHVCLEHVLIEKISHTMRDVVIRHSALENSQELITGSRQLKVGWLE